MPESPTGGARATAVGLTTAEGTALFIPGSGNAGPANIDLPPQNQPSQAPDLLIRGVLNYTGGGATTNITIRCRRGNGTGGAQVGTSQLKTLSGVSASDTVPFEFQDLANNNSAGGYTITAQSGGGAGTINEIVGSIDDGS